MTSHHDMVPQEQRNGDRTSYYTMKTPGRAQPVSSHSHSRSNSQSFFSNRANSPMSSPKQPQPHGQMFPPKLSPGGARAPAHDGRASSPNYFGLAIETVVDPRDSSPMPHENWSPITSSVKSFAAALPKQVPLDANPEFEAFKRQVDMNRGKASFSLSGTHFALSDGGLGNTQSPLVSTSLAASRPRPPKWHTHTSDASDVPVSGLPPFRESGSRREPDVDSLHGPAYLSADSERNSQTSLNPPSFLSAARHESPPEYEPPFPDHEHRSALSHVDDRYPYLSMMRAKADPPSPDPTRQSRADTVPAKLEPGNVSMIAPVQVKELLETSPCGDVIILDLRVSPQYAQSRVKGALNLCIPTTLLKRATFNLKKLQQTFQGEHDQERFAAWHTATHLVVYDAASADKRDAVSAVNMLKKFTSEGYTGLACILRGGFKAFEAAYPHLVDRSSCGSSPGLSLGGGAGANSTLPSVVPIVGGVVLPVADDESIPFFSNIRQNQDLIDGVGQMDVGMPAGLDADELPRWLREAVAHGDHGKKVADQFMQIELIEQSRMRQAYSVFGRATIVAKPDEGERAVQLSGIEKGAKNRYKDILPFEHARVRLQGRPEGGCDYVNASHLQSSRSHKKYIASQGPLPATFEDFWSVIWDQGVRVIVMLTAESEGGQLKCHPYWRGKEFGPIKLRAMSEKRVSLDFDKHRAPPGAPASQTPKPSTDSSSPPLSSTEMGRRRANTTTTLDCNIPAAPGQSAHAASSGNLGHTPYVVIRKFALSHMSHPFEPMREITHLHYPSWPDFGVPAQPSHLLALVELANVMQRSTKPVDASTAASRASGGRSSRRGSITSSVGIDTDRCPDGNANNSSDDYVDTLNWQDAPETDTRACPMLVHCSAGCGRTGTFCTVDSVIDMLKRQRQRVRRRANCRIAARERRIAAEMNQRADTDYTVDGRQNQSSMDGDGDIAMTSSGEGYSGGVNPIPPLHMAPEHCIFRQIGQQGDAGSPPPLTGNASNDDTGIDQKNLYDDANALAEEDNEDEDAEEGIDTTWLGDESVDLIARTVEDFRTQRLSMVQSLRQFVLCYETVLEWVWRLQDVGGGAGATAGVDGRVRGRVKSMII